MKRIIQAMVVAALITGAQAVSADAFPGNGDPIVLQSEWTYADKNAAGIAQGGSVDPFPGNGDPVVLASQETHAERHAGEIAQGGLADAFPGHGDPVVLPAMSTYADQFVTERNRLASGASDPAASE